MKAYILSIATLLVALALPTQAQTTKAQPDVPSFPYLVDTLLTGGRHGTLTLKATVPGTDKGSSKDYIALPGNMAYAKASVQVSIVPDNGYQARDKYPKVYKTGTPASPIAVTKKDSRTFTFEMPAYAVTVDMAYAGQLKNVKTDSLTLTAVVSTAAEVIKLLPTKQPVHLQNDAPDSLAVTANSWALQAGTTFNASDGAVNTFSCALTLPDSIVQNGVTLTGTIRVTNYTAPLTIATEADLKAFRDAVNQGKDYTGKTVSLTADIALTEASWTPIGNYTKMFNGSFDGQGHCISGLNIKLTDKTTSTVAAGLFGRIDAKGTVKNLGVKGGSIDLEVDNSAYAGGIAGRNDGTISNCYTDIDIDVKAISLGKDKSVVVGGIAGCNIAVIGACYALGEIRSGGYAGGIAGNNYSGDGDISYCFASGLVSGTYTGGITNAMKSVQYCIALNSSIAGSQIYRISNNYTVDGYKDNYASPIIPGTWGLIGEQDGYDLTERNFVTEEDGTKNAFNEWHSTSSWKFDDSTRLPLLMTAADKDGNRVLISGQGDASGKMAARADFMPVKISTTVDYNEALHNNKYISIVDGGHFKVAAANGNASLLTVTVAKGGRLTMSTSSDKHSVKKLMVEDSAQVFVEKAFNLNTLLSSPRTIGNRWMAYGSRFGTTVTTVGNTKTTFYAMTGYSAADADKQKWNPVTKVEGYSSVGIDALCLLAIEGADHEVTFSAEATPATTPLVVPVDAAPTTGEALHTGSFLFCANRTLHDVTIPMAYLLPADGTYFERTEKAVVKPFQSYMVANAVTAAAVLSLRVGTGTPTANEQPALPSDAFRVWGANGQLHLAANTPHDVTVYNLAGQLVRRFTLTGKETLSLPHGIYLVHSTGKTNNNINITYKVSL